MLLLHFMQHFIPPSRNEKLSDIILLLSADHVSSLPHMKSVQVNSKGKEVLAECCDIQSFIDYHNNYGMAAMINKIYDAV